MAKQKTVIKTTKKPTGLKITRSGANMYAEWKCGDDNYQSQYAEYRVNGGKWHPVRLTATKRKVKFYTINWNSWSPKSGKPKLKKIEFYVIGRRKPYESKNKKTLYEFKASTAAVKEYTFSAPSKPSVSATQSEELENAATYGWSVADPNDSGNVFDHIEYQSILLLNSNQSNGEKAWAEKHLSNESVSATSNSAKSTWTKPESKAPSGSTAYVRWFRARAIGVNGHSDWAYAKNRYAIPYAAKNVKASASVQSFGGYVCNCTWESPSNNAHPIDKTVVEYAFATPDPGMVPPDGASWNEGATLKDTSAKKDASDTTAVSFSVPQDVASDQCLFVRVNNHYKTKVAYGTAIIASGGMGRLSAPTNLTVSVDQSTHRATISATNASSVSDSRIAIKYKDAKNPNGFVIGIIPHGESSVTVQCPTWDASNPPRFSAYAFVGTYRATTRSDGISSYSVSAKMTSPEESTGGSIPAAPANVTLAMTDTPGTIRVSFDWAWNEATLAELSWADHADAWESTDEPNTYEIDSTHASVWNISGLDTGVTWYVRVRLAKRADDELNYGAYSATAEIDLSSAPAVPVILLSEAVITEQGDVTASWVFVSTDSTGQASAEVAEIVDGAYVAIGQVGTAQYLDINAQEAGWASGETHQICVRVTSESGHTSEWSDPEPIAVAEPLTCSIAATSCVEQAISVDGAVRTVQALTEMPLTLTVTGTGEDRTLTVSIVRADDYQMDRPDESTLTGFKGETIAQVTPAAASDQVTITMDDLIGHLDDGAPYAIKASVRDGLGQSAEAEDYLFEVHWEHQAVVPDGTAEITEDGIAILEPIAPAGIATGDVCDIYRLSADRPVLVYPDAVWGEQYVDPYPTIGEYGGHRFVTRTANGDYTTADNDLAWLDLTEDDGDRYDAPYNIIEFGGGRVELEYNVDLSNSWKKDVKITKYLGGSVQGDWNPAVERTGDLSGVVVQSENPEMIESMRRLADYAGICHVRTKDGSSYPADVQVTEEYKVDEAHKLATFKLRITRVDAEGYDGMTLAAWEQMQGED